MIRPSLATHRPKDTREYDCEGGCGRTLLRTRTESHRCNRCWRVVADARMAAALRNEIEADRAKQSTEPRPCPVCGNDPSEHNWEAHYAEVRAESLP